MTLKIRLFGPFDIGWEDGTPLALKGAKTQALVALLATASEGKRTRAWLQDMLWGRVGPEHGRASLRQALKTLRTVFGDRFDAQFEVTNDAIRLKRDRAQIVGTAEDGEFLEGIDVREDRFEEWLRTQRQAPEAAPAVLSERLTPLRSRIRPSVAVIPFAVVSPDERHAAMGDAAAQEITRALSRSQMLHVISHLSCRMLNPRSVRLQDLRSALDVDYFIWGSLRFDTLSLRLDVDFIEAGSGQVRWTRRFDAALEGFFRGDDALAWDISREIGDTILRASVELAATRPMPDLETHTLLMAGVSMMHHQSLASFSRAREHIEEVLRRAPGHSVVHAWLAKWYILSCHQGWSVDRARDTETAAAHSRQALDLNPDCSFSLVIDGFVKTNLMKRLEEAGARYDQALSVDPNNALAWLLKGTLHAFVDEGAEAVACTARARALSPLDPYGYFFDSLSATACAANGDYAQALELSERSLRANRRHSSTLRVKTAALQMLGRGDEARQTAEELLRIEPGFTIQGYLAKHPAAEYRTGQEWASALAGAGIPQD